MKLLMRRNLRASSPLRKVEDVSPVKDSASEESDDDPRILKLNGQRSSMHATIVKVSNSGGGGGGGKATEANLSDPNRKTANRRSNSRLRGRNNNNNNTAVEEAPRASHRTGRPEQQHTPHSRSSRHSSGRSRSRSNGRSRSGSPVRSHASAVDTYHNMSMEESSRQDKQIHPASDIYQNLTSPSISRAGTRKNKKSIAPMPTLNEATTEEDESTIAGGSTCKNLAEEDEEERSWSFDSWDDTQLSFDDQHPPPPPPQEQPPPQQKQQPQIKVPVQPTVMQLLAIDEHRKACDQMKALIAEARSFAAEGREEDSIHTYKRALQVGRQDVHRIKGHLAKKCSLTERFYQLWLEIGVMLAEIRTNQANLHELLLDYSHATACLQEAISIHRRQATFYKSRSRDKARNSMKIMQSLEASVTRIETAKKHDSKRKLMHEQILQYQKDAATASTQAEKDKAHQQMEETSKKLKALETAVFGENHPLVADANSLLGAIALEQGRVDAAIVCMKQALIIMKKVLGMKHPRTGTKLLHLASVFSSQGQDLSAIDHYNMAVAVFRSCKANKLVGSTLNDTAVIHIRRKEFDVAIQLLRDSLEAYKSEDSSWDTVQVWRNLGECFCQQKDFTEGASALLNALTVQRDARTIFDKAVSSSEPSDNVPPLHLVEDPSIADTLRRLGKAYYCARRFEPALSYYKEACLIHKAEVKKVVHVSKSRSNVSLPVRQDELAQTIYCMAELYDQTGEYDQAAKLFSESLQLRLFSDAHKETRSNMVHCAMCLYGLGGIHMKGGEYKEAVNVIQQALEFCNAHGVLENHVIYVTIKARLDEAERSLKKEEEALVSEYLLGGSVPLSVFDDTEDLKALELKASEALRQGNLDEAVSIFTASMQRRKILLQNLKDKGDKALSVKYDTACTLFTFGKALSMRGDYISAEKAFKDSLKLLKKSGTSPESDIVLQICGELQKIVSGSS